jgi:SanA protein
MAVRKAESVILKVMLFLARISLLVILVLLLLRIGLALTYRGKTYTAGAVPERRVGIIFGAHIYTNNHLSDMLIDRMETGIDLYHAGKVDVLLLTGDRASPDYDEPEAMRRYAIARGVPDSALVLDGHGLRTYDSCYRAYHVYGVDQAILITQNFHLDRALMTCRMLGIDAVGVAADYQRPVGYERHFMLISLTREYLAIPAAIIDLIRGQPPDSQTRPSRLPSKWIDWFGWKWYQMAAVFRFIVKALKLVFRLALIVALLAMITPPFLRVSLALIYRGKTYTAEKVPERQVGIVFGAQVYSNGRLSAMLADRVQTAVDLYHAGKIDRLLMTGDNAAPEYNEPEAMRRYVMARGVPESAIMIDKGGLRTYDSCYRARHEYGVEEAVVITQNFHLDRVLMTCNALGIKSVGVPADFQRPWGYSRRSMAYSRTREFVAVPVALFDVIRRQPPPAVGG